MCSPSHPISPVCPSLHHCHSVSSFPFSPKPPFVDAVRWSFRRCIVSHHGLHSYWTPHRPPPLFHDERSRESRTLKTALTPRGPAASRHHLALFDDFAPKCTFEMKHACSQRKMHLAAKILPHFATFAECWRTRSRLCRSRFLRVNTKKNISSALFNLDKMCALLHRSKLQKNVKHQRRC